MQSRARRAVSRGSRRPVLSRRLDTALGSAPRVLVAVLDGDLGAVGAAPRACAAASTVLAAMRCMAACRSFAFRHESGYRVGAGGELPPPAVRSCSHWYPSSARLCHRSGLSGCTGSDVPTSVTFPLGADEKIVADLETFWRRKEGPRLIAEIPGRNWRGVRDSNPWPPA